MTQEQGPISYSQRQDLTVDLIEFAYQYDSGMIEDMSPKEAKDFFEARFLQVMASDIENAGYTNQMFLLDKAQEVLKNVPHGFLARLKQEVDSQYTSDDESPDHDGMPKAA